MSSKTCFLHSRMYVGSLSELRQDMTSLFTYMNYKTRQTRITSFFAAHRTLILTNLSKLQTCFLDSD